MRVRYFRTVGQTDIELPLDRFLTLVGPNNSGKTNLLRAVQMFFTGPNNLYNYSRDRDFTFGGGTGKTSLHATFSFDPESTTDVHIIASLDRLYELYEIERRGNTVGLSLVFSPSDAPTYQFLPNTKKPDDRAVQTQISRAQRQLVLDILEQFSCHYVPSEKSVRQLFDEVLNPFLRVVAADAVMPQIESLKSSLGSVSDRINREMASAGLEGIAASFDIPEQDLRALFKSFEFRLSDPVDTELSQKGQGIQSTAFFAALRWVSEEELQRGKRVVWLLEEPESYLHPELMSKVYGILRRVAEISTIVLTTHSLAFVPDEPSRIIGTSMSEGRTRAETFDSYVKATESIRRGLGVKFSDFFNLRRYNVAVEGKSDRELLRWFLGLVPEEDLAVPNLREAHVLDFGGVRALAGWLRATYPYICDERSLVTIFDGDDAGEKERRDLNGFFGNKGVSWQANLDYAIVRRGFAIEGLFPDDWIVRANSEYPNWFSDFAVATDGELISFVLRDDKKRNFQGLMMSWAEGAEDADELSWRSRWIGFVSPVDQALARQDLRLGRTD